MAIKTKSLKDTIDKWLANAGAAAGFYAKGVLAPKRNWQESTLSAKDSYVAGVQAAIARDAFGKGVSETSNSDWQIMASKKGAANYPGGVRYGVVKFSRKMGPVLAYMQAITLPPGGMRGSPANIERSAVFQREMAKFRTG